MTQKYIRKAAGWSRPRVFFNWLWSRIAHPKIWSATMVVTYAILIFAWVPAVLDPPRTVENAVGIITMYIISISIIVGSLAGIPSAFTGRFTVERWAVACVALGIVLYVVIIYTLHWQTDTGNRLPQGGTISALLPALVGRWVHVTRQRVAPKEEMLHKTDAGLDSPD